MAVMKAGLPEAGERPTPLPESTQLGRRQRHSMPLATEWMMNDEMKRNEQGVRGMEETGMNGMIGGIL